MSPSFVNLSIKGKVVKTPAIQVGNCQVIVRGRVLKIAEIFDEYWIEKKNLPEPSNVLNVLQKMDQPPDIFTFAQRIPDTEPKYDYSYELTNYAVMELESYDHWLKKQISSAARRNINSSVKKGVVVKAVQYDDAYVRGIMSIYNETSVRQGRKFWHYGKEFDAVKAENGTYAERSTYLAAYCQEEMIGYLKIVWDETTAALMQILSKLAHYDKRPNNALFAEAVRQCCSTGIKYLLYEKYIYGNKTDNSLTEFKRSNGFIRMDVPRYFVPLTAKGGLALRMGLHKNPKEKIPPELLKRLVHLRSKWYERKVSK
jgi:hypothetical protein